MTTQTEALKLALEAYLCREMPAGTVIGDPKWWVPRIANSIKEALAQPEQEPVAYIDMSQWPPVRFKEGALRVDIEHLDGQKLYTHPPVPTAQPKEKAQLLFEVDGEMLTANQIGLLGLYEFQQATGCDTAAEFLAQPKEPEQREPTKQEHNILVGALKRSGKVVEQPEQEPVAWCEQSELDWLNSDKQGASAYVKTMLSKRKDALAQTALYTTPPQRKPLTDEQKLNLVTNWFAEDWAIKKALGLLSDYDYEASHGIKGGA